jgi:hypothetical protein
VDALSKGLNVQYRRVVTSVVYDKKHDQVVVNYAKNPLNEKKRKGELNAKSASSLDIQVQNLQRRLHRKKKIRMTKLWEVLSNRMPLYALFPLVV